MKKQESSVSKPKSFIRPHWMQALIAIAVVVVIGLLAYGTQHLSVGNSLIAPTLRYGKAALVNNSTTASPAVIATPIPNGTVVTDAGVVWLGAPQRLAVDPPLFKNLATYFSDTPEQKHQAAYYKVGTDHGKDLILAVLPAIDPSGDRRALFRDESGGEYSLIKKHSFYAYQSSSDAFTGPDLNSGVKIDAATNYKSLASSETLTLSGVTINRTNAYVSSAFLSDLSYGDNTKISPIASTPYGGLYLVKSSEVGGVDSQTFVLQHFDGSIEYYQYVPKVLSDDGVAKVTWSDGSVNRDQFRYDGAGACGSAAYVATLQDVSGAGLKVGGKTSGDEPVYVYTDPMNVVVQAFYRQSSGQYYDSNNETATAITAQQYLDAHAIFIYKDPLGRYLLFANRKYFGAECGKPVVYLYPTHTMPVSVQVGANITKSEPAYGNGWNVIAQPNGTLTTADGAAYGSLFWEGLGNGSYPQERRGVVVPREQAVTTMNTQLSQLGLNEQERADFIQYWSIKLSDAPYVRLTWFGTRQMDQLAPLTISPKPDTVIRVFLDSEGLQTRKVLEPQVLTSIPRKGFTVVEWGGLLRK
jgi:hypothetical protein